MTFANGDFSSYIQPMAKANFILKNTGETERIAKRIARAGICSRREAETYIADGRIAVNGQIISSPALNVTASDLITVDKKPLPAREPAGLWRYYKPRGLIVTDRDDKNRETIFEKLPPNLPRLITVGRLDLDSEGLLLLTNDGDLARHLELPSTGWSRKYRVRVQGLVDPTRLSTLADGVTIDGIRYGKVLATLDRQMQSNAWLTVAIREGKNREIRRIMDHLGHKVSRLIRISYGPFQLGDLDAGDIVQIKPRVLAEQLGIDNVPEHQKKNSTLTLKKPSSTSARRRGKHAHNRREPSRHSPYKAGCR